MTAQPWHLCRDPLLASAIATKLVGLAGVAAIAWLIHVGLPVGVLYPLKASASFAAAMVIAIGFVGAGHPFASFGPANQITTVRAMLVAMLLGLIGEPVS